MAVRRLQPLTPELAPLALDCVAETFVSKTQRDPFSWLMNLKKHHWRTMAGMFIERSAMDPRNLSVVSLNEDTGKVDGLMCNEDWTTKQPTGYKGMTNDSWLPVQTAFNQLHGSFRAATPHIVPGDFLHCLYFTCVRPEARGDGVMKDLWEGTVDAARENSFRHMVADASSQSVNDVLQEFLGFREVASVPYTEFEFEGQKVFEELTEEEPDEWQALRIYSRKVPSNLY